MDISGIIAILILLVGGLWLISKGINSIQKGSTSYCPHPIRYKLLGWGAVLLAGVMLCSLIGLIPSVAKPMREAADIQRGMTATTPTPAMKGRLLWLAYDEDASLNVYQYTFGQAGIETSLTDLSPDSCAPDNAEHCGVPKGVISMDGRYLFLPDKYPKYIFVVDLATGERKPLTLPDVPVEIQGAFSPGNDYLAYTLSGSYTGVGYYQSGLYLYDLSSGETKTLYESPCAKYEGWRVCGGVLHPNWIDATTLLFNGWAGEMPGGIRIEVSSIQAPAPNHTFVIDTDGNILQEYTPVLGDYLQVQGETILVHVYPDDYERCRNECPDDDPLSIKPSDCLRNCVHTFQWFKTNDLKQGDHLPQPLTLTVESILSGDGETILHWADQQWHLMDLRNGSERIVDNLPDDLPPFAYTAPPRWSPDNQFFADSIYTWQERNCVIQISSIKNYPDFILRTGTMRIELLGWLP